ncbi:hypothetical protein C7B69_04975 [filamentous cyanobacterium Phorm 46]|nr:hypothetical protein C7B69_04975 [filamentous cyanobacterium Phorm 46]PSB52711.1 hypothetical protein C7B67_05950 [filamentous cyanobacterium Phorm 6]
MKSATLPSFWENYNSLDSRVKEQVIRPGRVFEMVGFRQLLLVNPPLHRFGRTKVLTTNLRLHPF